jgi:hypothetical protein
MEQLGEPSPRSKARLAGFFWLMTVITGAMALALPNARDAANIVATACYLIATLLVYQLLKPVNRNLSLVAAAFSVVGCILGVFSAFGHAPLRISPLVFFGVHCLLVGSLIVRSTFLPRFVGILLAIGGLGWLTNISPPFASTVTPFNVFPGVLGETVLSLWLIVKGVNVRRWHEQALGRAPAVVG